MGLLGVGVVMLDWFENQLLFNMLYNPLSRHLSGGGRGASSKVQPPLKCTLR